MLQRIQSVFLFLVAVSMITMLFLPYWYKQSEDKSETHTLSALHYEAIVVNSEPVQQQFPYMAVGIFAVAIATIALISISKFKNRMLQIKLGALNSLLLIGALGAAFWFTNKGQDEILPETLGHFGYGFFMPAVAMVFNSLANRFIRKDEKLVRSVDRIR